MYKWNGAEMCYPAIFPKKAGEALKIATPTQLKVLVWMATCDQKDVDAKAAAAALGGRVTEADCADALAFWQKEGVLLASEELPAAAKAPQNEEPKTKTADEPSPANATTDVPKPAPAIKTLTANDAAKAKQKTNRREFFQLLHKVEARFGTTLKPLLQNDLQNLAEETSLPEEVFIMAVAYAVQNDKANFKYIKTVIDAWEKEGINTVDAVDQHLCHLERREEAWNTLVKWLSLNVKRPTATQKNLAEKWIFEFGQSQSLIALAYDMCLKNSKEHKFYPSYMDRILCNWHEDGITAASQVKVPKKNTPVRYTASAEQSDCGFDFDRLEKLIAGHTPRFRKKES